MHINPVFANLTIDPPPAAAAAGSPHSHVGQSNKTNRFVIFLHRFFVLAVIGNVYQPRQPFSISMDINANNSPPQSSPLSTIHSQASEDDNPVHSTPMDVDIHTDTPTSDPVNDSNQDNEDDGKTITESDHSDQESIYETPPDDDDLDDHDDYDDDDDYDYDQSLPVN